MIQDRIIVCIASAWDYDPTSKHHVMSILSETNDVIWVNYHGSRRPSLRRGDLGTVLRTLGRVCKGVTRVHERMVQLTPLVVPGARGVALRVHERLLVAQIRRAVRRMDPGGSRPVQVWTFAPDTPFLLGKFQEECFVYYCVDEYTQFKGFDLPRIEEAERAQIQSADIVVTTSSPLFENKRRIRNDVALVRHGVDYQHFARSWTEPLDLPGDLRGIARPIFGFFGLIHHWVDLRLLQAVASRRSDYSFVMIGDRKCDLPGPFSPNVHFLGRRAYSDLPAYCSGFDAGLLLFEGSAMARHVNPIKMSEYLAAGLPIVSTPLPEAERYPGAIRIAHGAEAFASACDEIVRGRASRNPEDISRLVKQDTWRSRVETLASLIEQKIAVKASLWDKSTTFAGLRFGIGKPRDPQSAPKEGDAQFAIPVSGT